MLFRIKNVLLRSSLLKSIVNALRPGSVNSGSFKSGQYWEGRYAVGGTSGPGSYGKLAEHKASVLNEFVLKNDIHSVIEFGSGDGNQLSYFNFRTYLGFDVSKTAIRRCRSKFANAPGKAFKLVSDFEQERADLVLSLDVIYHLVEDIVYEQHMRYLFAAANRFVAIYSSNEADLHWSGGHVRHRKFTDWVDQHAVEFRLLEVVDNDFPFDGQIETSSSSNFYFFEKQV